MIADEIHFCPRCGSPVTQTERFGHLRPVCPDCDWIYFADPKVAVAVLIKREDKVLMVRRAVDPKRGLWSLPAGYVDAGEDPAFTAQRECLEETGLKIHVTSLIDVIPGQEHPRGAHILIAYRAEILSGDLHAEDDIDRAAFFSLDALPPLAFSTTERIIRQGLSQK